MNNPRTGSTRFALRGHSRIAYDPGTPLAGDHTTLVLLHDLLFDRSVFDSFRQLQNESRRMIIPEMRGHGASATLANQWYSIAELADDVVAVLDAEEIRSVHIVGHGLGGVVALELGQRGTDRFRSITIIEPALYVVLENDLEPAVMEMRRDRRTNDRSAADFAYKGLVDRSVDVFLAPRWGIDWRERATRPRLGSIRRHAPSLAGVLPALDSYQLEKNTIRNLSVPTNVLVHEDATTLDRVVQQRLVALLPQGRDGQITIGDRINSPFCGLTDTAIADFVGSIDSKS